MVWVPQLPANHFNGDQYIISYSNYTHIREDYYRDNTLHSSTCSFQFGLVCCCFLHGGGLPWRIMCFSKLSRMATAILWTWGSVWTFSLMLYKCCKPPSSINMLQYLAGFLLQTCCMAHTAHNWTPGVMKQPSRGKNGLKDL